jgi:hypothetical protein
MSNQKDLQTKIHEFIPSKNLHQKYGFDLDKVQKVRCLKCHERIGNEEYILNPILARFGQMFFIHKKCYNGEENKQK